VHADVSPDLVASVRDDRESNGASVASLPDFEQALELTYQARVHPRVVVGPDVQWVRHPGLSAVRADACVIGLRMVIE
jgi:carbohydrate-selective porin OprB